MINISITCFLHWLVYSYWWSTTNDCFHCCFRIQKIISLNIVHSDIWHKLNNRGKCRIIGVNVASYQYLHVGWPRNKLSTITLLYSVYIKWRGTRCNTNWVTEPNKKLVPNWVIVTRAILFHDKRRRLTSPTPRCPTL